MGIRAVSHVAVGVRDMDVALGFYRDILGLRVAVDRIEEFPQGDGEPPARRRAVYLRWEDGPHTSFLALDQPITKPVRGAPATLFQMGLHHFAFWVDDLDTMMERIRAAGIAVVVGGDRVVAADTDAYGERPGGRVETLILRDPEGNYVQLDQRA